MADLEHGKEIHELTTAPSLSTNYWVPVDTGSVTYKTKISSLTTTASQNAYTYAQNASNSATSAASSASAAQTAAQSVSGALSEATTTLQGYVHDALAAADSAAASASEAASLVTSDYARAAKSYAVGDTGYREGEDTDNSKYYKEQSANYSVISGSYSTISGNYAAASEESKIYSQTYMNNSKNYSYDSEGWAKGTRNGSNVPNTDPAYNNNSKYYSQRSSEYATQASRNGEAWAVGKRNGVDVPNTDPAYHNNSKWWANTSYQNAEAWADGQRGGVDVPSTDPAYHNNAKWWAEQAEDAVSYGIVDMVGATATTNGSHGAAVQPVAGQQNHYLKGNGKWSREDMTVTEITDSAPYLYRASAGGDRQYDTLIGGSVVWNQTAPAMSTDNWEGNNSSNVSVSSSDGIITATIINPPSSSSTYRQGIMVKSANRTPLLANHKYLISYIVNPSVDCSFIDQTISNGSHEIACSANSWNINTFVDQPAQDKSGALLVYPTSVLEANTTYQVKNFVVHDLTLMFGSTIADYIYAREIAEAGSGMAWLKSYGFFSKDYYAYDVGSLLSVNTSGHKLIRNYIPYPFSDFSPSVNYGVTYTDNGDGTITAKRTSTSSSGSYGRIMNMPLPKGTYTLTGCPDGGGSNFYLGAYKNTLASSARVARDEGSGATFTVDDTFTSVLVSIWVKNSYSIDKVFTPILTDDTGAVYTYPLTPTDLRGTLSLSGDDLVYDGDVYESDGTETVKYGYVDLGTLAWDINTAVTVPYFYTGSLNNVITKNQVSRTTHLVCSKYLCIDDGREYDDVPDKSIYAVYAASTYRIAVKDSAYSDAATFKTAMDGVYLIYPLETPTTATLSPFVTPQICDKDGTEEYIDTRAVPMPVGHYTEYYGVPEWLRDRYLDELREYPYNPTLPVDPTAENIANFKNGSMWVKNANLFVKMANIIHRIPTEPIELVFSSDGAFTLSVATPGWDGTIEYSIDDVNWTTWDGSELSGTATQPIYLRGKNNTVITGGNSYKWTFTGKYVTGNIETLLDYEIVASGQHPIMGDYCYSSMFYQCTSLTTVPQLPAITLASACYRDMFRNCTSLTTVPQLPAITLASNCYGGMFNGCTSLTTAPQLPATTLVSYCYQDMFSGCTSLTTAPELPATTLAKQCYDGMFANCTSLTTAPELPATTLASSCYIYMFYGCTSLKLSATQTGIYQYPYRIPTSGTGTTATDALTDMFVSTGGTFTGTPTINTTYYTDHQPV